MRKTVPVDEVAAEIPDGTLCLNLAPALVRQVARPGVARHHGAIEERLTELKNIIIQYYPEQEKNLLLNATLLDLFSCERELAQHCKVEDLLFVPAVASLERRSGQ